MNRIALAQMQSTPDIENNLKTSMAYISEAADANADLIAFPETFLLIGDASLILKSAESIEGPLVSQFQQQAAKLDISILMGSFCETNPDETDKVFNTSILIDRNGNIVAVYRKIHLFSIFTSEVTLDESLLFSPGSDIVTCDHEIGKIGLSICYDMRFPNLYQKLGAEGAQIIFVPSAFTVPTGKAHWLTLLKARAIENQTFIAAPAQFGKHTENRESFGKSVIFDPWGNLVSLAPDKPGLIFGDINLKLLEKAHQKLPVGQHKIKGIDF
jgi:deaminated glutathione amidase